MITTPLTEASPPAFSIRAFVANALKGLNIIQFSYFVESDSFLQYVLND